MYIFSGGWSLWARSTLDHELREDLVAAIGGYDTVPAYSAIWDDLHLRVRNYPQANAIALWGEPLYSC